MKAFSRLWIALRCRRGARAVGAGRGPGNAHRLVGQGLLQVRGRRAVRRDQEVRGQDGRQGRAVPVPGAGHDPEDRRGARRRHAARRRVCRRLRLPGHRQMGVRRQARGPVRHPGADQGQVSQEHRRDDLSLQRQDQEEGVLRVPAQAADDAYPVLDRHAGGSGLQGVGHSDRVEGLLVVLVRQGAAGLSQEDRGSASTRIGFSRWASIRATRSIRSSRSPTPTTSRWSTTTASCWSTIRRSGRG